MSTFRVALIVPKMLENAGRVEEAAAYRLTPEYQGAAVAKAQEKSSFAQASGTGAFWLASGLVGGAAAGAFASAAPAATVAGDAAVANASLIAPAAETTGAFDVGGSAGVFSSTGAPLYVSPAASPLASAGDWLASTAKSVVGALASSALAKGAAAAPGGAPGRSLLPGSSSSSSAFPSSRRASSSPAAAANDTAFLKVALAIAGALAGVALIARFA